MESLQTLQTLQSLGLELPSPAYILGAIVFGLIGWVTWRKGRKQAQRPLIWLGVALMFFPYAVSGTWLLYSVGAALCAAVYFSADSPA